MFKRMRTAELPRTGSPVGEVGLPVNPEAQPQVEQCSHLKSQPWGKNQALSLERWVIALSSPAGALLPGREPVPAGNTEPDCASPDTGAPSEGRRKGRDDQSSGGVTHCMTLSLLCWVEGGRRGRQE